MGSLRARLDEGQRVPAGTEPGDFPNTLLAGLVRRRPEAGGYDVLMHRLMPLHEGGPPLGQVVFVGHVRR
jgi:hydrogenase maturation factor HypF (carbamoyltransferase family)